MKRPKWFPKKMASPRETFHMTKLLFLAQMKPLRRNLAAGLVFLGLLLLPPLYAWFNIGANWDPYGLTSNLKVAVTSEDEGAEIEGVTINVGDEIIESLKANDSIGWQFVDHETGQAGVDSGAYYAALVIPEDFSRQLTGFLHGDTQKGEIEYYINEKENAISTKIMGTGMDTVSNEIDKTFVETVTTIVLDSLKVADSKYAEYEPTFMKMLDTMDLTAQNLSHFTESMDDLEAMLDEIDDLSTDAESVLPKASQALRDASALTLDAQDALQSTKSTVADINRLLNQNVLALSSFADTLRWDAERLSALGEDGAEEAQSRLQDLSDTCTTLRDHVTTLADNLSRFNQMLLQPLDTISSFVSRLDGLEAQLDQALDRLSDLRDGLADGSASVSETTEAAVGVIEGLNGTLSETWDAYNDGVSSALSGAADDLSKTLDDSYTLLESLSALVPAADDALGSVRSLKPLGTETIEHYKSIIEETQDLLEEETGQIKALSEDEQFDEVLAFIREDAEKQSAFLSEPVKLETNRLYPVEDYGSGMSPFYTTLAIWVGCLLMMAMISTINEKGLEAYPKVRVTPMYLSRLALWQLISACQCVVIALGDLFILRVECVHPVLFVLLCIFIGQIFSIFIFSLVFTFSAIGKALAIIVLVLQIAASGGTFPIEMTPTFFQLIHPLLPFTYCIGAMREVCFGIYAPALIKDLVVMASLPILSVVVVIFFGPMLRRFVNFFERSMKKSGLM